MDGRINNIDNIKNTIQDIDIDVLKRNRYIDNLIGVLWGNALGDAYGLSTEFLSKDKVDILYPMDEEPVIPFPDFKPNRHNTRWQKGDWTDDTDQMILILRMFIENKGNVDAKLFGEKLREWVGSGFKELGDIAGMGLGQTVGSVVFHEDFLENPFSVSKWVWINSNKAMAANGALMRTSIAGCVNFNNTQGVLANTIALCKMTHYDIRCIISCTTATYIISTVLSRLCNVGIDEIVPGTSVAQTVELLIMDAKRVAKELLFACKMVDKEKLTQYWDEYEKYMSATEFVDLDLSNQSSIGYTYKCLGAAILCMRKLAARLSKDEPEQPDVAFRLVLNELIREGGDADTNAAVAGSLLGVLIGYNNLPKDMLDATPHRAWFEKQMAVLIKEITLNPDIVYHTPPFVDPEETDSDHFIDYTSLREEKKKQEAKLKQDQDQDHHHHHHRRCTIM
ncbi:hypothetical protein CYY_003837 [Polysphondylium violaceum]|uniref:ADP-ribosylglycohydrolase n=1 Tax=Polysphondylium violaceum TaxID=133409 RepID=A0A8J4V8B2_9MYCE|nr:hypothetical protein CYY_003837 [Polysphondylium violaceum]